MWDYYAMLISFFFFFIDYVKYFVLITLHLREHTLINAKFRFNAKLIKEKRNVKIREILNIIKIIYEDTK